MAVIFLPGPLDKSDAQKSLENQISQKLCLRGSESDANTLRTTTESELRWVAQQGMANLYLLLTSWVKFLQENQLAWWTEMPKTPVVGWLLGIRQTLEAYDTAFTTPNPDEGIAFITSGMGERLLLASAVRTQCHIEDPEWYVPIRWNCFWPRTKEKIKLSGVSETLKPMIACNFFRYDGLTVLEKLERGTRIRRRDQVINSEEIREVFRAHRTVSDAARSSHLFFMYLLWKESELPVLPRLSDKKSLDELLYFPDVRKFMEELALATIAIKSGQNDGDPYAFFVENSLNSPINYRFPPGNATRAKNCRRLDRRNLLGQGLSARDLKWMDGLHHLYAPQYLRGIGEILIRIEYYRRHHPLEWRRIMETKRPENVSEELKVALELVESSWLNLAEYQNQMATGKLADYEELSFSMGDRRFEQTYPLHPMAERNRFVRIGAADRIRDLAASRLTPFPEMVLDKIHVLMFDCSAAVRHSLATALYHAGDHTSVGPLEQLVRDEKSSGIVCETAEVAAKRCWQRGLACKEVPVDVPALSFVSSNVNLAIELNRTAKQNGCRLLFPEPDTGDLFVFPAKVCVVNRRALGTTGWRYYIDFMEETVRSVGEGERKMLEAENMDYSELSRETAAVILTDGFSPEEEDGWGHLPATKLQIFRAEEWMEDWIVEKVRSILENNVEIAGNR